MESLTLLFVIFAALALMLVFVSLRWARDGRGRTFILALFALLLPAAYAAPASLLGRAKPVTLEWLGTKVPEATVLSATFKENDAIYLTLLWTQAPNLYKLPWNAKMAEQLQQAMREADRNGTHPMMKLPFEQSWDDREPRFYALPQPKMPDKPNEGMGIEFQHPGQRT
ncbi:hypothetical protein [Azospirillum sp. sgz301742]